MAAILVIEDNSLVRQVLRSQLQAMGHTVLEAEEGETALGWLSLQQIDAVILDLNLPGVSGDELLDYIRRKDLQMPVLISTVYDELERAVNLMRRGAFCFLTKPVSRDLLKAELDRALEFHRLSREKTRLEKEIRPYQQELRRLAEHLASTEGDHTLTVAGFRLKTDTLPRSPEALDELETQFDWLEETVRGENGTPHQFVGSEVLAVFSSGEHALRAARAALKVRQLLGAGVQVGGHCGPVLLSSRVVDYSGVDDLILTTSLLLHVGKERQAGVLVTEPLYQAIEDRAEGRSVGRVPLRTSLREVRVFELSELR